MKTTKVLSVFAALALASAGGAFGQTAVITTTTSDGTISEFSPDTIIIRSQTNPEPVRYSYSKTTTYVDENGQPVSLETVKSGLPVTIHYVREGDRMIANRVIVHRHVTTEGTGTTVEKKTTTTTTEEKK